MEFLYQEKGGGDFINFENSSNSIKGIIFFLLQFSFLIIGGLKINSKVKTFSTVSLAIAITLMALFAFRKDETKTWLKETWDFSKKILPYLFIGVFIAGILTKLLPENIVTSLLGNNNLISTFITSIIGLFMYFATLTEVPIVQALTKLSMSKGPTPALLMARNSLSLPSMMVITKLFGKKKIFTYFSLVVVFSTIFSLVYGNI